MTVNVAPTITTQPANQTVTVGGTATFTAAASGNPTPTVQWQVSTNNGSTFTDIGGATAGTYSLTAAAADTGKQFRAVFTNSVGAATSNPATLTVSVAAPAAPTGLVATPAGFTKIRLTWTASGGATSYTIKRSTTPGTETTLATGVTGTSYSDTPVAKGQPYYYVVSAVNSGGASANSAEAGATTPTKLTPLDFDGDGKGDLTYVRPATFSWNTLQSNSTFTTNTSVQWGLAGDMPVPGDYDGDGIIDPAVYRPSSGTWYALLSSTNLTTFFASSVGVSTDIPVPGDYVPNPVDPSGLQQGSRDRRRKSGERPGTRR